MDESLKNYLLSSYSYDAVSGVITNRHGRIISGFSHRGYLRISAKGKTVSLHRLAWLLSHGVLPKNDIDHIDGCRSNNKLSNLREATRGENHQNRRVQKNTKSGLLGAYTNTSTPRGRPWRSIITKDRVRYDLGTFHTAEDAHAAYLRAKKELHDFNPIPRENAGERSISTPAS